MMARFSYRCGEPGFVSAMCRVTVFFNGRAQSPETGRDIINADEDRGEIRYYAYEDGAPVKHPTKIQTILERVERGKVWIIFHDNERSAK
jgi:hypothetical protein